MFKKIRKSKYNSGITIIELLVVIAIFMIISAITIFNYSSFRSSTTLRNLADDIALSVRRAQGYAIGVRGYNSQFQDGYGIHFTSVKESSDEFSGSGKSFILFTDVNGDGNYDAGSSCGNPEEGNECLEVLTIASGNRILEIYLNNDTNPIDSDNSVDILFKRPNPEPTFCYKNNADSYGACEKEEGISRVRIKIANDGDYNNFKIVTIYNNGQISVS